MRRALLLAGARLALNVGPVGSQLPRLAVVSPHQFEHVTHRPTVMRILDRRHRLDASVEVARHPVR